MGVALFLSEEIGRCVRSWQCVSERIIVGEAKGRRGMVNTCASVCSNE